VKIIDVLPDVIEGFKLSTAVGPFPELTSTSAIAKKLGVKGVKTLADRWYRQSPNPHALVRAEIVTDPEKDKIVLHVSVSLPQVTKKPSEDLRKLILARFFTKPGLVQVRHLMDAPHAAHYDAVIEGLELPEGTS